MQATAKLSAYRQAPRKVRLVAGLVRGKQVDDALVELNYRAKRAAPIFAKLISSAVANAKVLGMDEKMLRIKELRVDKGPVLKRSRPRAQGRAFPIHKHTSHIIVTLTDEKTKKISTAVPAEIQEKTVTSKTKKETKASKTTEKKK